MKVNLSALLVLAALPGAAAAQSVGSMAPEVDAKEWFNPPPATTLAELRGKVVFVEFWATW
jgi:thiol-disulfide isomerase/thioredoxin